MWVSDSDTGKLTSVVRFDDVAACFQMSESGGDVVILKNGQRLDFPNTSGTMPAQFREYLDAI